MKIDINEPKPSITITFDSEEEMDKTLEKLDKITDLEDKDTFLDSRGALCKTGDLGAFSDRSLRACFVYLKDGKREEIGKRDGAGPREFRDADGCYWEYFVKVKGE